MNVNRRKAIQKMIEALSAIRDEIDELRAEEQDYFDNMPESFQQSERGEKAEAAVDALQTAYDSADECVTALEEAVE